MKPGSLKKTIPFLFFLLLIIGAQFFTSGEPCCGGSIPLSLILSPLGCSDSNPGAAGSDNVSETKAQSADSKSALPKDHKVTFIEIGSVNCIPCKMMQPIMKSVEEEYRDQVKVMFHDVWTQQGKLDAMKYGVQVIPTQIFLDASGKEYFRHQGFFPKEELVKVLKMKGVR